MTGILDKFYVEHGIHGARVMTRSHQLTAGCDIAETAKAKVCSTGV